MARKTHFFMACGVCCLAFAATPVAQADEAKPANANLFQGQPLSLSNSEAIAPQDKAAEGSAAATSDNGFMGVNELFQIREANPNVRAQQWELLVGTSWATRSQTGSDEREGGRRGRGWGRRGNSQVNRNLDEVRAATSIKYGITDDLSLGLEVVPIRLGEGDDEGAGDLSILYHWRIVKESDAMPAIAQWGRMRIPSGDGSSGVDAEFHGTFTKTLAPNFRAHLDGFVMTANGEPGETDTSYRQHFQWGIGPGFDYSCCENVRLILNYLHRNSTFEGNHNNNILELGTAWQIDASNAVRFAFDIGLDGEDDTPNLGAKLQWGLTW